MITVIDYRMGNLRSVQKGFEHAGVADVVVTDEPSVVMEADGLVLPGVGAFRDAASNLRETGMWDTVLDRIAEGIPFLGICLGMQLLASVGLEDGRHRGLGVVPGTCERLPAGVKVPHIGWNTLSFPRKSPLFDGVGEGSAFYFVHSYHVDPEDRSCIIAEAEHGSPFAAALQKDAVFAVQFHPEKSSGTGLRLLSNFGRIVTERVAAR